jgi:hypothetical protein
MSLEANIVKINIEPIYFDITRKAVFLKTLSGIIFAGAEYGSSRMKSVGTWVNVLSKCLNLKNFSNLQINNDGNLSSVELPIEEKFCSICDNSNICPLLNPSKRGPGTWSPFVINHDN